MGLSDGVHVMQRANLTDLRNALVKSVALTLTGEQTRFLALHANRTPTRWQWLWGSTILRAHTDRDEHATISAAGFDELVRLRLMKRSGLAGATITTKGREALQ